jgi:hypothetical protein
VRRALTPLVPGVDRFGLVLGLLVLSYLVFALGGSSTPRILEGSSAVVALWLALHASAVGPRVRLWAAAMLLAAFLAVVVIGNVTVSDEMEEPCDSERDRGSEYGQNPPGGGLEVRHAMTWIEPATSPVHQFVAIRSKPCNKDVGHIGSRSASST